MDTGPCGTCAALMHKPWLDWLRVAPACVLTRKSETIHLTVTQGLGMGGVAGIVNGHPATMN